MNIFWTYRKLGKIGLDQHNTYMGLKFLSFAYQVAFCNSYAMRKKKLKFEVEISS